jgi:microcystin-dependent protein
MPYGDGTQFLACIGIVPYNFAPYGWSSCNGQLIAISQNTALFSLIGTFYGGNGTSNFALPNLQGMAAVGVGQGVGLSQYVVGQMGGSETTTLLANNIPSHTHTLSSEPALTAGGNGSTGNPINNYPGNLSGVNQYASAGGGGFTNALQTSATVQNTGGGQPVNNMQPYLVMTFIIAMQGVFPPRS